MTKKRYAIIGGSGFVGTHLISLLGEHNCVNYDKRYNGINDSITQICDIRNIDTLNIQKECDTVILLAAEHRDDVKPKSLYYDVNVEGTKNVLSVMEMRGINNLIFTSSVAVYGLNRDNPNENSSIEPFNDYGNSKWNAEQIIRSWYEKEPEKKSINIIRPTVIFGENNRGNVYNLMKQIVNKNFVMIGNGNNKKSMAYVGNITEFINNRITLSETGYHIYNYVDSPDLTMNELVNLINIHKGNSPLQIRIPFLIGLIIGYSFDIISIILNKKLTLSSVRVKKFCATTKFDASKAQALFSPKFSINEALERTIKYEFENKSD